MKRSTNFKKYVHEFNRIIGRAFAVVDARQIRHVGIVRLVQVLAVPAGLEMDLGSKAILASGVGHPWGLCSGSSIETGKGHAVGDRASVLVGHGGCVVRAGEDIAREHTEAGGKGFDV